MPLAEGFKKTCNMKQSRQLALAAMTVLAMKANAGLLITIKEVGPNVVATASGSLDMNGYTGNPHSSVFTGGYVDPSQSAISVGAGFVSEYTVGMSFPSLGTGGWEAADSRTGDPVSVNGNWGILLLPQGYVSGTALSGTATWNNKTLQGLGLLQGSSVATFGTGGDSHKVTLTVVPEPHQYAMMAGVGLVGLGLWRRHARK